MRDRQHPFESMERLFEQMRRSMGTGHGPGMGSRSGFETRTPFAAPEWSEWDRDEFDFDANVSMETDEDGHVVYADLPGFEREELDVRFEDGVLVVEGSHEVSDDGGFQNRRVHERLSVPGDVREDDIEATYRNGVLKIRLPVDDDPDADTHRIDIE